jgi:perosamine synthetase
MPAIPLSAPDIDAADHAAVDAVLRSGMLSLGPKLSEFEEAFAAYIGVKHAVAVSSGTAALHLCVRALGIHEGDEVITTPFSFIASSNCILFEHAKPVFVDIDPVTLCIDPGRIEQAITKRTKAIIAVDVFGALADWHALRKIASKHNLALIEDSCESLGSKKGKQMAGAFADCATFAFYPNKQMTTGEGGMLVTNRKDIADLAKAMRNQGRNVQGGWLAHEHLGYNYRLSDLQCALGLSQLRRLPTFIEKRASVAQMYAEALEPLGGYLDIPVTQQGVDISWFVYVVRLKETFSQEKRDAILAHLRLKGVGCQNYFPPIHLQPYYRKTFGYKPGDFPITESIANRTIALPFHNNLSKSQVSQVCSTLKEGILAQIS